MFSIQVPEEDDTEWFGDGDNIEATTIQEGLIYYDVDDYNDNDSSEFGGDDNNVRQVNFCKQIVIKILT